MGAAVCLARKTVGTLILTSPCYLKSVSDLVSSHPEVQAFTCETETCLPKDGKVKLFDSIGKSILNKLEGSPVTWYEAMGVPFSERWDSCPIRESTSDIKPSYMHPVFVHDDVSRGFVIPVNGHRPGKTASIIEHVPALKGAREIHCMDSSFFNLIESMDPIEADLFYYPEVKGSYPYSLRKHHWNVVS